MLDRQIENDHVARLRGSIEERSDDRVADLHIWCIGHGIYAAEIAVVSDDPKSPDEYKSLIPGNLKIVHVAVEVHCSADG